MLDRLGVELYRYEVMYGKRVEMMRPLADIFEDLNKKGATSGDMSKIFGRIGGSAGIMFLNNYDKLRELTIQNRASHGISGELAEVKQNTTKGLWYQMTSQISESFMQGYEILEPQIRGLLKDFLSKFKAPEFARGLASLAGALLDIFSVLGKIAAWFGRHFNWLEPLIFSGLVATKLFKLAGAVMNLGVALGFLGKQSVAASGLQMLTSLTGLGGKGVTKALSFAQKRSLVTELTSLGITGKGAMTAALTKAGVTRGTGAAVRGAATGLFATQVVTGKGLIGAGASIGALGAGAIAATAGITALIGALGWVAYKTWKLKQAKDAVLEDVESKKEYRYKSLSDLYAQMEETRKKAVETKGAVDDVTGKKQLKEETGQPVGAFTGRWWKAVGSYLNTLGLSPFTSRVPSYTFRQARLDNLTQSIETLADTDVQQRIGAAWAELGKENDPLKVEAFLRNVPEKYSLPDSLINSKLITRRRDGSEKYVKNGRNFTLNEARQTAPYVRYVNDSLVGPIQVGGRAYLDAISDYAGAKSLIEERGLFDFDNLTKWGFYRDKKGQWVQRELPKNAKREDRVLAHENFLKVRDALVLTTGILRDTFGGQEQIAANIMEKAGFSPSLYSNEPLRNDPAPFDRNGISVGGADDGGAGGNYSGTGKLSSAAPKQVIVNITNLLSVETIDLLKTPEGQTVEIQNLKGQLAQALIDTVHDFDSSWNG